MTYKLSPAVEQLLKEHMASGEYDSEEDVLIEALRGLSEYKQTVADVREGLADEQAGRVQPLEEVDAELRERYGIARNA